MFTIKLTNGDSKRGNSNFTEYWKLIQIIEKYWTNIKLLLPLFTKKIKYGDSKVILISPNNGIWNSLSKKKLI